MRLIDADRALEIVRDQGIAHPNAYHLTNYATLILREAPTVDAVEVVHGYDTGRCRVFQCSECGYGLIDIYQDDEKKYPVGEFNYCPNCGAKIDGGFDYLSGEYTKRTPCNVPTAVCECRCLPPKGGENNA